MPYRILMGVGLLLLGYYVGREIGRAEAIRKELEKTKTGEAEATAESQADTAGDQGPPPLPTSPE
jgi:hypothetical protein